MFEVADRVAVVTGGARGIGRAIVRDLARAGADVMIADIAADEAEATATALADETGRRIVSAETDVTDLESVSRLQKTVTEQLGPVSILVNNAGWDRFVPFLETTPEFWERLIAVNFRGVLHTCYVFLPAMVARQAGVVVNIASDAGRGGSLGESVYGGCKAGVIAFSKTLAREHARDNIRINVVSPGITRTPLYEAIVSTEFGARVMGAIARTIPLGRRPGEPEEIAPAVVFLASDAARYVTGQVLSVNGGLTMLD